MTDSTPRPGRVLVIEDDPSTRETFERMLVSDGYTVSAVPTVEEGLTEVSQREPDAVLLDLHLPLTGGLECLRRLRAMPTGWRVPVAILTGDYFLDEDVAKELHTLGARVHFKPVWDTDLRVIVHRLVTTGPTHSR